MQKFPQVSLTLIRVMRYFGLWFRPKYRIFTISHLKVDQTINLTWQNDKIISKPIPKILITFLKNVATTYWNVREILKKCSSKNIKKFWNCFLKILESYAVRGKKAWGPSLPQILLWAHVSPAPQKFTGLIINNQFEHNDMNIFLRNN